MKKLLISMILILTLMGSAMAESAIVSSGSAKFYRYPSTSSAKVSIKKGAKVTVSSVKSGWAQVKYNGVKGYMKASALSTAKSSSSSTSWKSKVIAAEWYDGGSDILKKGRYGYIYGIDTGVTVKIKRMGGSDHADVEPATKSDTLKLKKLAGGSFSWDSKACILYAGGKYVACAINTKPHGDQTIKNNGYDGQFCLHMLGSKTHGSDTVNSEHQKQISRAYTWAH